MSTKIERTEETWNPYYELTEPLHWKKPRMIVINSIGDLFHPDVPFKYLDKVFTVMTLATQHVFQVLTKRPERMVEYFGDLSVRVAEWGDGEGETEEYLITSLHDAEPKAAQSIAARWLNTFNVRHVGWPLPNVWLGVSAENQETFNERYPHWLRVKHMGWMAWWSLEPLLGPIQFDDVADDWWESANAPDWVIVGGESGPSARPMHPEWARSLRDQCGSAGVPRQEPRAKSPLAERK